MIEHLSNLRNALLALAATGPEGFEGLLSAVLTEIIGVPFRLAGSGSQFGVDGKSVYEFDAVCFEGKRYDGKIPRDKVLSKIAEVALNDAGNIDLWVLGATSAVSTQLAKDVQRLGEKDGIATVILDWRDEGLSPLAVVLAMAVATAESFFRSRLADSDLKSSVSNALRAIKEDNRFADHEARLLQALSEPTIGAARAMRANGQWLTKVLSDRQLARRTLRQPLCPGDRSLGELAARAQLVAQTVPLLMRSPDGRPVFILGGEGYGKSWLVAQSWLSIAEKPLTLFLTADDFGAATEAGNWDEFLITKLVAQTGDHDSEAVRKRWRRKFRIWSRDPQHDALRLLIIVDGLNQRPKLDWSRLIEAMSLDLKPVGSRIVATCRESYFESWIRPRLDVPFHKVLVGEWSTVERDTILATRGIRSSKVNAAVAAFLCNPRLLGIALELLGTQIEELEDLSVSRLLFEHMRALERDAPSQQSAQVFARSLQNLAREVLKRIGGQQRDDLTVFDAELDAVSEGRFFTPLDGDSTRYLLNEDGLTLALGFAVLDELRMAHRNGRDIGDALSVMIEPVGAIDRVADTLLAALTVACINKEESVDICCAIICEFAELQNPNAGNYSAFKALAIAHPEAFLKAAFSMCRASAQQPSFDWVEDALLAAKHVDRVWALMCPHLHSWLARYSLAPEAHRFSDRLVEFADQPNKERVAWQKELNEALSSLTRRERSLLNASIQDDDGDLAVLASFAFKLIAGKPVAPFAKSLAQWSLANALNAQYGAPHKDFMHLVRLNSVDWREARESILTAAEVFEASDASNTGRWALVYLLRSTGDPRDALRVDALLGELVADRSQFGSWRLVEKYCATDPCDPASKRPDNIAETAVRFAAINVAELRTYMGQSTEDLFFSQASPGIARFEPQIGIDKYRELIEHVLGRKGHALRFGTFELRKCGALILATHLEKLMGQVKAGLFTTGESQLDEGDSGLVSQFQLMLVFPFLSAAEQVEAVLSEQGDILVEVLNGAKSLDGNTFEKLLGRAVVSDDERAQFITLAFGKSTATPISAGVLQHAVELALSSSERVRAQALGIVAKAGDEHSLKAVIEGGWSASGKTAVDGHESWYGSLVIIEGAARGLISHDEAIARIDAELFGRMAVKLGADAARRVARYVDASIKNAAALTVDTALPDIVIPLEDRDLQEPPRYRVSERTVKSRDSFEAFLQQQEHRDSFEKRQSSAHSAFENFRATLTRAKAGVLLQRFRILDFDAIATADKPLAETWVDLFMGLPVNRRGLFHHLGLLLVHALANWNPGKAMALFSELSRTKALIRMSSRGASISLETAVVWTMTAHPALRDLQFARLDQASNDDELAEEVLAALWRGKQDVLQAYIEAQLQSNRPAAVARALTVAGFSDQNEFNDEVLARHKGTPGFIGSVQAAAMYAYERHAWAVHWHEQMRLAQRPEDFWRYSVLFTKVADARIDTVLADARDGGAPYQMFIRSVSGQLENRYKKWRTERQKKLFGEDAPSEAFLSTGAAVVSC